MSNYAPSNVRLQYSPSANPPILDRVVFTIDHMHGGGKDLSSTYEVVKHLVENKIPVTVFMECYDPKNFCKVDEKKAKEICDVIKNITGKRPPTLSYHGKNASPEKGITFKGIKYARGIKSWTAAQKNNPLDTPVMGLYKVKSAFKYIKLRNEFGFSAALFVHSAELKKNSPQKRVFDTLVKEVKERRLQALDYYSAMGRDFDSDPKCPLAHFTNNKLSQNIHHGNRDGRGGITQVFELQGFLNELGLDAGFVDGIFGDNTKMAVLMYQVDKGLTADGSIGDETRVSINSYCN